MPLPHAALDAIDKYRAQEHPIARFEGLFLAFELVVRIDVLPLAAAVIAGTEPVDPQIREFLSLEKPSLGIWVGLLQGLTRDKTNPAIAPLHAWVSRHNRALELLKGTRNKGAHATSRMNADRIAETLATAETAFETCLRDHPDHGVFEPGPDGTVVLHRDGLALGCEPFILPGRAQEALLLYEGRTPRSRKTHRLKFSSVAGEDYECPDRSRHIDERLGVNRAVALEVVEAVDSPKLLRRRADDATAETLQRLTEARTYRPEIFVERAETDAQLTRLLEGGPGLLLVEGPSGAGKTSWVCAAAKRRLAGGAAVFLESADRLDAPNLPDALAAPLFFEGAMGPAFDRLDELWSSDGRVLVALDSVGADGNEGPALRALFRWAERLSPQSPVRLVATIDSARWERFSAQNPSLPASVRFHRQPLRPFTAAELRELDAALTRAGSDAPEGVRRAQGQTLARLAEDEDAVCRRPGLVVDLLEAVGRGAVMTDFSPARVYEAIWRRVGSAGGKRLLLGLAELLLARRAPDVEVADEEAAARHLFDAPGEPTSPDLRALLAERVLAQSADPYLPSLSFANPRFFEFVAALTYRNAPLDEAIRALAAAAPTYPPAAAIAGHLVVQALGRAAPDAGAAAARAAAGPAWRALAALGAERDVFVRAVASLDRATFLSVFAWLAAEAPPEAHALLGALMYQDGQPMLAARAAELVLEAAPDGGEPADAARLLRAQAFYEVDDYRMAEAELRAISPAHAAEASQLRGDIAEALGQLEEACAAYQAIIDAVPPPAGRSFAEMKLGYVLGRRGLHADGERHLRRVLNEAASEGDSKMLAEAWGDLGQILVHVGRFDEARACLGESLAMNRRMGLLVGIGVVEGLYGELATAEGRWQQAETRLRVALSLHRKVENRWRLWWTLERLIPVLETLGRADETPPLRAEADVLARQMGVRPAEESSARG